jgi:DNA polymerase III epsilon subunit-like protein
MNKSKKICFLYTDTNGLHELNENVTKKNLFGFARLVSINYEIGYVEENKFISKINNKIIIKPRCMYIGEDSINIHKITNEIANNTGIEIELVLNTFLNDIKDVDILISHNIIFHLRAIQAELIRYNIVFNFKKYLIIDTINFFHQLPYLKLKDLYEKLLNKKSSNKSNLELIRKCFFTLYNQYDASL